jgi:hypothetical protein
MGFKKSDSELTFAELALASSMEKNRSLVTLMNMNDIIDWSKIKSILLKYYKIGFSNEGADAYPPLMLFKTLLLQNLRKSLVLVSFFSCLLLKFSEKR